MIILCYLEEQSSIDREVVDYLFYKLILFISVIKVGKPRKDILPICDYLIVTTLPSMMWYL